MYDWEFKGFIMVELMNLIRHTHFNFLLFFRKKEKEKKAKEQNKKKQQTKDNKEDEKVTQWFIIWDPIWKNHT